MGILRVGILGCGGIARIHARCLQRLGEDRAKIVRAYDLNPAAARAFAEDFGGLACHKAEEVIEAREVDAVYICTMHDSHPAFIKVAVAAGKHIFCEKPLALDFDQAKEAFAALHGYDRVFALGYNHRFTPANSALKELLVTGALTPRLVHLSLITAPFLSGWAGTAEYGGGILVCLGSHLFDLFRYFVAEEVHTVRALAWRTHNQEPLLEDTAAAVFEFGESGVATFNFHDAGTYGLQVFPGRKMVRTEVYGREGAVLALGLDGLAVSIGDKVERRSFGPYDHDLTWGYLEENRRFLAAAGGEAVSLPGAVDGLEAARLVEAARRSAQEQRPVAVEEVQ